MRRSDPVAISACRCSAWRRGGVWRCWASCGWCRCERGRARPRGAPLQAALRRNRSCAALKCVAPLTRRDPAALRVGGQAAEQQRRVTLLRECKRTSLSSAFVKRVAAPRRFSAQAGLACQKVSLPTRRSLARLEQCRSVRVRAVRLRGRQGCSPRGGFASASASHDAHSCDTHARCLASSRSSSCSAALRWCVPALRCSLPTMRLP